VSEDVSNQQIPSADFPRQQFRFLSADSVSRFLFSADLLFVSRFRQQISLVSSFIFSQQMSLQTSAKRRSRRRVQFRASLIS
jgi:hypothetical protein